MLEIFHSYLTTSIFIVLCLYCIFALSILIGWFKLKTQAAQDEPKDFKSFSILIAARNESHNIDKLLQGIEQQNYPQEKYEIIIIDDHSEDDTVEKVKALKLSNLQITDSKGKGKKEAIHTGLELASNEFIIQTDADCFVKQDWIKSINAYIRTKDVKLLIAPVLFNKENSFFSQLQALDFMSLMMSTAGLAGIKQAIMANGANLIYPKAIIEDLNILKPELASGDDVFLLHHCKRKYGKNSIHFLKSTSATVETQPSENLKSFFNQRLRWASKARFYKDKFTLAVGLLILSINLLLLTSLFLSFVSNAYWSIFASLFISKAIIDFVLLMPILAFYKRTRLLIYFPILSLVYLFYTSFVGLMSQFATFEWKNRRY